MFVLSPVINMPFGLDDLEKVFEVSELLENKEELITQFKPEVSKYLVKKPFFKGRALKEYERQFDELIAHIIKREIIKHHPQWTPEEILLLTDVGLLKLLCSDYYFDQSNYTNTKEGML